MCERCEEDSEFAKIYDSCAREGCNHYRCEHGQGEVKTVYSKNNPETVGQIEDWGFGCLNAGCVCDGFIEPEST